MYILNPDEELLKEWYRTNKHIAHYLAKFYGFECIYKDKKGNYYFVKTQDLINKLKDLSILVKVLGLF